MKKIITVVFLLLVLLRPGSAQSPLKGVGKFTVAFDMARFYGDEHRVFVEMYYGIHENLLSYTFESGQYTGTANMKYILRNDSGIVATKQWTVPHALDDSTQLPKSRILTGLESVALAPGNYVVTIVAFDAHDAARRDSFAVPFTVDPFPVNKESFSDIELSSSIQSSSDQQSLFYKNTLEVIPNAGRLFGTGLPILYYYVEVYSLSNDATQSTMSIHAAVLDAAGREVVTHDKVKPRLHDASVEIGTMNLSALRSGTYQLRINLVDSLTMSAVSVSKKFFVYKLGSAPDTAVNAGTVSATEYVLRTQEDLEKEFSYAKYISTDQERTQYKILPDLKSKQNFMYEFWQRRNPEPASSENSFKKEYFKRLEAANKSYAAGMKEGWNTDRGRILIVYGLPDEIDRNPSTAESNPYEIWHYNSLQGGVIFVFVDRTGLSDYSLVHSTHRDELHDENWYDSYALKAR